MIMRPALFTEEFRLLVLRGREIGWTSAELHQLLDEALKIDADVDAELGAPEPTIVEFPAPMRCVGD